MSHVRRLFKSIIDDHSKKLGFIYLHYTLAINNNIFGRSTSTFWWEEHVICLIYIQWKFVWLNPCIHIDQSCIDIVNQHVNIMACAEQVRVVSK